MLNTTAKEIYEYALMIEFAHWLSTYDPRYFDKILEVELGCEGKTKHYHYCVWRAEQLGMELGFSRFDVRYLISKADTALEEEWNKSHCGAEQDLLWVARVYIDNAMRKFSIHKYLRN